MTTPVQKATQQTSEQARASARPRCSREHSFRHQFTSHPHGRWGGFFLLTKAHRTAAIKSCNVLAYASPHASSIADALLSTRAPVQNVPTRANNFGSPVSFAIVPG